MRLPARLQYKAFAIEHAGKVRLSTHETIQAAIRQKVPLASNEYIIKNPGEVSKDSMVRGDMFFCLCPPGKSFGAVQTGGYVRYFDEKTASVYQIKVWPGIAGKKDYVLLFQLGMLPDGRPTFYFEGKHVGSGIWSYNLAVNDRRYVFARKFPADDGLYRLDRKLWVPSARKADGKSDDSVFVYRKSGMVKMGLVTWTTESHPTMPPSRQRTAVFNLSTNENSFSMALTAYGMREE